MVSQPQGLTAPAEGYEGGYDRLATVLPDGSGYRLAVRVTGAHCAHCIQKIESAATRIDGVNLARLNFSTQRLTLEWQGVPDTANQLVETISALGYRVSPIDEKKSHQTDEVKQLVTALGVAGFAMGNIMLISVGVWAGIAGDMGEATRSFMHWITALIAVPAVLFSGRPFFTSAWASLKAGGANMDVPISLALILATGMSLLELSQDGEYVYFDSAVMLTFFLLIGRTLDMKARQSARQSAEQLMEGLTGFAHQLVDGQITRIPHRDIRPGMTLLVARGEKIPADGRVSSGSSLINTALVTGESDPRPVTVDDQVYAGTINLDTPIELTVDKANDDSLLAEIVRLIEAAEQNRSRYVVLADRAAQLYTPLVHTLAGAAFFIWWQVIGAPWQESLMTAVTVLIITCPCALGLAVPVVQVLATSRLMKAGVMVKSGDALERLARINAAFFDKTGTLTSGEPRLVGTIDPDNLALAAALAANSRHPLATSLAAAAEGMTLPAVTDVEEREGEGLIGQIGGQTVRLGSRRFVGVPDDADWSGPEVWMKVGDGDATVFRLSDTLRREAKDTITRFKQLGIKTYLLSGDRHEAVAAVGSDVGIETAVGQMTPQDKFTYLETEKERGSHVLMVGDGLNDTPVMAAADVSMAPGTAIDMAQASADIVYPADDLSLAPATWQFAKRAALLIKQNFALAALYNMIAVPLAFAGYVTPLVAALAMSLSSIVVISNSYRIGTPK